MSLETVVVAYDSGNAERIALYVMKHGTGKVESAIEITKLSQLPKGWDKKCIPWVLHGLKSSWKLGEILENDQ